MIQPAVMIAVVAIFAPLLTKLEGQDTTTLHQDLLDEYGLPIISFSKEHWFGVEPRLGRDLFARFVYGARPSLIVAITVTLITGDAVPAPWDKDPNVLSGKAYGLPDAPWGTVMSFAVSGLR